MAHMCWHVLLQSDQRVKLYVASFIIVTCSKIYVTRVLHSSCAVCIYLLLLQCLIVQSDLELATARVESLRRQVQQDTLAITDFETSLARSATRVSESKEKKDAAIKKLGACCRCFQVQGYMGPSLLHRNKACANRAGAATSVARR